MFGEPIAPGMEPSMKQHRLEQPDGPTERPHRGAAVVVALGMACALSFAPTSWGQAQQAGAESPAPEVQEEVPVAEEIPAGVEQILPRGQIAAIDDPVFVPAASAKVPDDAWVLGVVVEGKAKAYSLNLLNRHEVVNDQSGGTAFAAVW